MITRRGGRFSRIFAVKHGITNVIDLFPIFEADMAKYYLESDVHFSQAGHDATADAITAYILDHPLLHPEGKGPSRMQKKWPLA
jgi:hypothetical protein